MLLVDRVEELRLLEAEYGRRGFSLVVVYGRRRLGKTYLLRWFCRSRPCVYYVAAELPYEQLAAEFSAEVSRATGLPIRGDVVEVLEALCRLWRGERLVVVLDEFQYMVEADPSLPSRLQRSIDTRLGECGMMLVLCGSAVSFFERRLLGYRAPLYGRRTAEIRLRPLSLEGVWGFNPSLSLEDATLLYMVAGGTPAYLAAVPGRPDHRSFIRLALTPGSPLYEEPLWLLKEETREPRTYLALLRAVAEGRVSPSEAAQAAGIDPRSVTRYVELLEELWIVERVRPLGRRKPVQLRFRDNYFRFWFTFVLPLRHVAELRGPEEAARLAEEGLAAYAGRVFSESVVAELALRMTASGVVPVKPVEHGPWWRGDAEIDYVVREPGNATAFFEAKWSELDTREARRVLASLEEKAARSGLASHTNYYVLIARRLEEPIVEEGRLAVDLKWLEERRVVEPAPRLEA